MYILEPRELAKITNILNKIKLQELETHKILHLTANENIMSKTAASFLSSNLSGRYHVATYDDCPNLLNSLIHNIRDGLVLRCLSSVFELEKEARFYANKMFHSSFCDFRPLSGLHGVFSILSTVTKPGDNIYVFNDESLAHYATKHLITNIGRRYSYFPWDGGKCDIDLEKFEQNFTKTPSKCLFFDIGTAIFPLPIREIRRIVGNDVILIYDASHVLGLIAGGLFQNPLEEGCDILIGNTHKTFPGPVKGIILYKNEDFGRWNSNNIFDTAISSQHTHHSIALYITILEMAMYADKYALQIVNNNQALSKYLHNLGFEIFMPANKYPESHIVGITGKFSSTNHASAELLLKSNISLNSRKICNIDALRIGVQEVTRKGMVENDMKQIASFFEDILLRNKYIASDVVEFNKRFTTIKFSFDNLHLNEDVL